MTPSPLENWSREHGGQRRTANCFGSIWHYYAQDADKEWTTPIIGLDTEYSAGGAAENKLLSYQFFATSNRGEWRGIHYPAANRRMRLARYIGSIVQIGLREGCISKWPSDIYLCAHFALADFPAFSDLRQLVGRMDSVRRTFISLEKPLTIICYDNNRHGHSVRVHIRDSMLLAPNGKSSLKALGSILGLTKLFLKDEQLEHMDTLLNNDPFAFEAYALRDPEIAALYCAKMWELNRDLLGSDKIPFSLSSLGVAILIECWKKAGLSENDVLGKEVVSEEYFNGQYTAKRKSTVSRPEVHLYESFAAETYHGGRNEQYIFGAGEVGHWNDWDLCGAYTTAMALLGMPNWTGIRHTRDLDEYQPMTLGFARVEFRFPADTRFPCLPVRTEAGLIYPIEGTSLCCSPEVYLAVKMGATVCIRDGIILPQDTNVRPFADFIVLATKNRKQHPKGSIFELAWKELGNGTYGKTAQGLRPKRCYSSRKNSYDTLPPSRISNPYFAAWVTSFVRAVLGEILASLPGHVQVCNVTTDGLLCTATPEEMGLSTSGPLCTLFQVSRYNITGKRECVEAKHSIDQPLGMRTRGQLTLQAQDGGDLVVAKAGVKPPMRDKTEQNEWLIALFTNRSVQTRCTVKYLRSIADICRNGGDLTPKEISRIVRLDYDWKRAPDQVQMSPIRGTEHIAFQTRPWPQASDAIACRNDWAAFSKATGRVLRSVEDLQEFEAYRAIPQLPNQVRCPRKGGARKLAARQFLRAFVRSQAGLNREEMSYRELAELLTNEGVKTTKSDVENAARKTAVFKPQSVPNVPVVLEFFAALAKRFPNFQVGLLVPPSASDTANKITAHLGVQ